ncbi:MAG: hypothetical protein JRN39_04680 [Nitrososphaerota archaeon]|nr:hypothetical protein [Nitrososphaerota archaeon]
MGSADYFEFLRDALAASHGAVLAARKRGDSARSLGSGYYGDETFQVDKDAEDAVVAVASAYFDSPVIISEERGKVEGKGPWILMDPVDGSTNAKRDASVYATAIAVAEGDDFGSIVAAGVIDHVARRVIWGDADGVYEDWHPAATSGRKELADAMVTFDSKLYALEKREADRIASAMSRTKYPRMLSTAALETAYVASGRVDAYVAPYGRLRAFDCFPSLFMLDAAGGKASVDWQAIRRTKLDTKERVGYVAAASEELLQAILRALR